MAPEKNKFVLITGAAGGIGHATASRLLRRGWQIFAADLQPDNQRFSSFGQQYVPIQMDVTSLASVEEAFHQISSHTSVLNAIIHMAGILRVGSLVEIPEDHLARSLEINLMGAFRVNKQFLPLLLSGKGRIILLSSETGTQTAAPFNGPYAISKHALEAYGDALRRELSLLGIRVVKIQPGPVKTQMTGSGEQKFAEAAAESMHFNKALTKGASFLPRVYLKSCDADLVASTTVAALESHHPKSKYKIRHDRLRRILDWMPAPWADHLIKKILTK